MHSERVMKPAEIARQTAKSLLKENGGLRSNNEKSAITSRNKVLSFLLSIIFCITVLHCNGNIILEKPLDFMHCVASSFGYPNYRLSELSMVTVSSDNRRSAVINSGILQSSLFDQLGGLNGVRLFIMHES